MGICCPISDASIKAICTLGEITMKTISDQVMEELLQEEIAKLMFFIDRHNRWKLQVDSTEESRQHRLIADLIKEAADATVLVLVGILVIILLPIPQEVINDWEPLFLIFVVFPLGLLVATDPERRKG